VSQQAGKKKRYVLKQILKPFSLRRADPHAKLKEFVLRVRLFGIWGGLSERERRRMRRSQAM